MLRKKYETQVEVDCGVCNLEATNKNGRLHIVGSTTSYGLSLLIVDALLKEDFFLDFHMKDKDNLFFNYCREGQCFHTLADGQIHYQIQPLTSSITSNPKDNQKITIAANMASTLAIMILDRTKFNDKILCGLKFDFELFESLFKYAGKENPFFYQSFYSIAISECIKQIQDSAYKGLINKTFFDAKALDLLSKQLFQYKKDRTSTSRQVLLRKYDVQKILEAKQILVENFLDPPTILNLSKEVGINQQKLKKGFKTVFDTTINKFLTDFRLEMAATFIIGGLSVKEVSGKIGYANSSHFARKFREKYGILPKDYRKTIMSSTPDSTQAKEFSLPNQSLSGKKENMLSSL